MKEQTYRLKTKDARKWKNYFSERAGFPFLIFNKNIFMMFDI